MMAVYCLWLRELKRYFRSPSQIVAALGQPVLYLLTLGFGLSAIFSRAGEGSYLQFVAPGVVGMSVLFSASFSGTGVLWDRQYGHLREVLVAPVPRLLAMIGRTLGGATISIFQGLLMLSACFVVGFRPVSIALIPAAIATMGLIAIVFCAMGTMIGSRMENSRTFPLVVNLVMMPLFFTSGALFPLDELPTPLRAVVSVNPLTYGVDALRASLSGVTHFGLAADTGVLITSAVIFVALGAYSFSRIEL